MAKETGHEAAGSLGAGNDEEGAVDNDFVLIDIGLVALVQEVVEKVAMLAGGADALQDLLARVGEMADSLLAELGGRKEAQEEPLQEAAGVGEAAGGLLDAAGLDGLGDERHPEAQVGRGQAAKGLAEAEVADDVKGGVGEPVGNVADLAGGGKLGHAVAKDVDVGADEGLLLEEGPCAKGVAESAALARVIGVVGHGDCDGARHRLDGADVDGILVEVGVARPAAVNVLPRGLRVEGELRGREPHDGAVPVVDMLDVKG